MKLESPNGDGSASRARAVLVVDDHPLFCEAISMALARGLGLTTVAVANRLQEALSQLEDGLDVDAIVLDLNLPDVTGVDGLLRLKAASPRTPVIVVSGLTEDRVVTQSLKAGAAGFVRKDTSGEDIVAAFRTVMQGGVATPADYQPARGAGSGDGDGVEAAVARLAELTPQQLRILSLVCEGKLNKQIAYDLDIAETTVKAHITAILRKLGVQSRTQAVLIAQKGNYMAPSRS